MFKTLFIINFFKSIIQLIKLMCFIGLLIISSLAYQYVRYNKTPTQITKRTFRQISDFFYDLSRG